jgi:ribonuclease HI
MQHDWDYRLQHEKRAATFQQQIRSGLGGGDSYQDAIVFDSDDDEDSVWEDGAVVAQVTIDEDDDEEALVESSLGSAVLHNSITQHRDDDNTMHQDQHVNLIQQDGKSFQTAFTIEDDHDDDRQIRKTHLHRRVELGKSMQRAIIIEDSDEDDDSGDSDIIPFEIHRYDGQRKRVIKASIRRKTRVAVRSVGRGPEYRRHRKSVRQQAKLKARSDHTIKRAKLMAALSLSSSGSITSIQARIIEVYTDGSCVKKGKGGAKAGWGVYWPDHRDVNSDMYELNEHGRVPGDGSKQTSDRAELLGVIQAIRLCPDDSAQLVIWTDSRYCINGKQRCRRSAVECLSKYHYSNSSWSSRRMEPQVLDQRQR